MRRGASLGTTLLVLSPAIAVAGGTSYDVRVKAYQPGEGTEARFVVESSSDEVMPGCRVVEVIAEHRVRRLWSTEKTFTRQAHLAALKRLMDSSASGVPVRFGIMGSGLKRESSDGACVFRSRGLALLDEPEGASAIYSVYKYP